MSCCCCRDALEGKLVCTECTACGADRIHHACFEKLEQRCLMLLATDKKLSDSQNGKLDRRVGSMLKAEMWTTRFGAIAELCQCSCGGYRGM